MAVTAAELESLRRDMRAKLEEGDINEDGAVVHAALFFCHWCFVHSTLRGFLHPTSTAVVSAWHIGAAQLIAQNAPDEGSGCVKAVRDALQESDTYNRLTDRNAMSMADRLRHVLDLRHLLDRHLQSNRAVGM